ncbi:MAG: 16S rRNA (cytosine(967)-C(5))-methyltransferase RsmB [Clostridia bacterium]|nr:16S rRNA (cytosine(967)-C(5))-methyltransferase RsmB [Clostridia bacterium]
MVNPRKLVLDSLIKSETVGSYSNIEINTTLTRNQLSNVDSRLYTLLYLGTLEKKLYLDYIIKSYSKIKLSDIEIDTKCALRLGLYQLIFCDKIPDYSAIDESVSLAPKKSKGFVNAILRSFLRDEKIVRLPKDELESLSIEASIPMKLLCLLIDSYGKSEVFNLLKYNEKSSPLSIRVNTLRATKEEIFDYLSSNGYEPSYSKIAKDIIICNTQIGKIKELIDTGKVFIQDESSKIATEVFSAEPNEKILDACACPGGKSFSIAIDMENKGELLSCDLHESKLRLITNGAKRLGIDIITAREQNAKLPVCDYIEKFDRVLCDVPCSGLGIIFKKPDIKYKSIEDIKNLPKIQYEILNNCSKYVKIGGVLVYSTCTLNKQENENNIEKFLQENKDFEPLDFSVGDIKSKGGVFTFLPHRDKTDGFFVAKMVRKQ